MLTPHTKTPSKKSCARSGTPFPHPGAAQIAVQQELRSLRPRTFFCKRLNWSTQCKQTHNIKKIKEQLPQTKYGQMFVFVRPYLKTNEEFFAQFSYDYFFLLKADKRPITVL